MKCCYFEGNDCGCTGSDNQQSEQDGGVAGAGMDPLRADAMNEHEYDDDDDGTEYQNNLILNASQRCNSIAILVPESVPEPVRILRNVNLIVPCNTVAPELSRTCPSLHPRFQMSIELHLRFQFLWDVPSNSTPKLVEGKSPRR